MYEKLIEAKRRSEELNTKLCEPEIVTDIEQFKSINRELKNLTPIIEKFAEYETAKSDFVEAEDILKNETDAEIRQMAYEQLENAKTILSKTEEELKLLLLPRNPDDDRSVIMEIRGGVGGEESSLFANSLYRMYTMYAATKGFKTDIIDSNQTELGGFKEVTFEITGESVFAKLKYESGVHRVQRVPETESSGRIHTSAVTVAVLPQAEEVDVEINSADLEITACRSSGAGGQKVNKTSSAIRIVHKPTGIVVECQEERSQFQNKDKAMRMLYSKLYEQKISEETGKIAEQRKIQVGTGDRSERIRTYNYPQGRVTDHRIGLTLYKLENFLNGDCDEVFDALRVAEQLAKLQSEN